MLAAQGLVKRYGPRTVVDGVAVQVERGETVGLLGPNGAGKTTTVYMIVGLVRPDAGDGVLDGKSLSMNRSYVLLDEPFTGVDPRSVAELQDVVRYLKQRGLGIVITDHNVRDTLAITDRATIIHEGRILLEGKPDDILADPDVRRVFLGERFEM